MIRVLVVATTAIARAGLSAALIDPTIKVVGTATNLDTLEAEVDRCQPDVILLDLGDSPQALVWEKLKIFQDNQAPSSIPIALYDWEGDLLVAMNAGVRGILPDTSSELEISAAIMAIARGWLVIAPEIIELLDLREKISADSMPTLTAREIEVLIQIGAGLGNKAIGQKLHISDHTVKFHISSVFQKLGVSTRTEAVTAGIRIGLIML
jgi:two-component system, NarL family, response regulator YdfI